MPTEPDAHPPARIVLLVGPSGCGKTHLARLSGLPVVTLDDFYRAGTDPSLPRCAGGEVDWEDPDSWDADAATTALTELCHRDRIEMPTYAFGEDRVVSSRTLERHGARVVVAEGIFAAQLIDRLRVDGLLVDAILVSQHRGITFGRRLLRDLREGRKSRWYLVRQGWAKTASEPEVLARQRALGARPVSKRAARRLLASLAATGTALPGPSASPVAAVRPAGRAVDVA